MKPYNWGEALSFLPGKLKSALAVLFLVPCNRKRNSVAFPARFTSSPVLLSGAEHHCGARDPEHLVCSPGPRGLVHVCLHHQGPADEPPLLPCVQHSGRGKTHLHVISLMKYYYGEYRDGGFLLSLNSSMSNKT